VNIKDTYRYQFPAYALPALFNGDDSGMEQEDIDNLEAFLKRESYIDTWDCPDEAEPYFTWNPEFGLACDCVDIIGIIWEQTK